MTGQRLSVDHRRELLLRAGLALLGRHDGPPPVGEIARAAGVSKGLLYHYFPDKDDFLVEVVRSAAEEITEATRTDPERPPEAQIDQAIGGFLGYAHAHSAGFRAIFDHRHQSPRVLGVVAEQRAARLERTLEQVVGACPEHADRLRASAGLRTALDAALSFIETATLRWLRDGGLTREQMHTLLTGALHSALELAERIDPDLAVLDPPGVPTGGRPGDTDDSGDTTDITGTGGAHPSPGDAGPSSGR